MEPVTSQGTVSAGATDLAYVRIGHGAPVVVMPGGPRFGHAHLMEAFGKEMAARRLPEDAQELQQIEESPPIRGSRPDDAGALLPAVLHTVLPRARERAAGRLRIHPDHRGKRDRNGRAPLHVGEIELVGTDVSGISVHETARIMASARADEILLSDLTRSLAGASDLAYEDRGVHALNGLDGEWHLWALASVR
jgi:class 3 adenylate cyclase